MLHLFQLSQKLLPHFFYLSHNIISMLIIFFMLVSELTKMEIEEMTLPTAVTGISEKKDPKNRLIINVTWNKETRKSYIIIKKKRQSLRTLRNLLEIVAAANREAPTAENEGLPVSDVLVKIRADAEVPYENVMMVMGQCARVFIYKISFAVKENRQFR